MSEPAVDIVIPCYNASQFLARALDSVLAQTFPHWRILLIDDGSTDSTPELVRSYAPRLGARLLALTQPNRGLPAARNTAIRAGSAPLIALLDADDVWLPHRLERSIAALAAQPAAALSYGFVARIDEHDRPVSVHDQLLPGREGNIAPSIYTRRLHLPCPTITFRRAAFAATSGFDETMRATEDRDLWLRLALRSPVVCIPEIIALYRTSPGAMTTDTDRMFQAQRRFVEKHKGAPGLSARNYRHALGSIYRQRAETETGRRLLRPAALHLAQSLRLHPLSRDGWRTAAALLKAAVRPG